MLLPNKNGGFGLCLEFRANGVEIEYQSMGGAGDPAILLVMGFASPLTSWPDSLCAGLAARGFRVIRFDNRDIGRSTHLTQFGAPNLPAMIAELQAGRTPVSPYSLNDMAADTAGLLSELGIERAHVAGVSMGGMIAQLVAVRHPVKARSLISIMSTTARRDLPPGRPEAYAAIMAPPKSAGRDDRIARGIEVMRVIGSPGFPASDAEIRAAVERGVDYAPYDPAGLARQMAAIITAPPRNDGLEFVKIPALVIHGADDSLIPVSGGKDTAQSIPGAVLHIVPGMAHDLRESLVPLLIGVIGDFVAKVEAGGPAA